MPQPGVRVRFSKKENDLIVDWDSEMSKSNPLYIIGIFTKEIIKELDHRGYDTTTLRFSIRKKK